MAELYNQSISLHNVNKSHIIGHNNEILKQLEDELKVKIDSINGEIKLTCENKKNLELSVLIINEIIKKATGRKKHFRPVEINDIFSKYLNDEEEKKNIWHKKVTNFNEAQQQVINSFDDNKILVLHGPAGTGKSFIMVYLAVMGLQNKKFDKIILTRPIIEGGGENLGFLPGNVLEKIHSYMIPFYDAFSYLLSSNKLAKLIENKTIEIRPIAHMRGTNFYDNTCVLVDEAQNINIKQMLLLLTRLCKGAKIVLNGDETQTDLKFKNECGLINIIGKLNDLDKIKFIEFTKNDNMRDELVNQIIDRLQNS